MLDLDKFHFMVDELEMPSSQKVLEKSVNAKNAFKLIFHFKKIEKFKNGKQNRIY